MASPNKDPVSLKLGSYDYSGMKHVMNLMFVHYDKNIGVKWETKYFTVWTTLIVHVCWRRLPEN